MTQRIEFKSRDLNILIKNAVNQFIKEVNSFKKDKIYIGLSGGRSVNKFYIELNKKLERIKSKQLIFFLLDERVSTRDRNSSQIRKIFGKRGKDFHFLKTGNSKKLLNDYNKEFKRNCSRFDFIIAGVGEDGHIASLFPNSIILKEKNKKYLLVKDSPKKPPLRITVSPKLVTDARISYLFFMGRSKQKAFENFKDNKLKVNDCPAKLAMKTKLRLITNLK